jgi:hypothetical protein
VLALLQNMMARLGIEIVGHALSVHPNRLPANEK